MQCSPAAHSRGMSGGVSNGRCMKVKFQLVAIERRQGFSVHFRLVLQNHFTFAF